jgi:predicted small secreted protein
MRKNAKMLALIVLTLAGTSLVLSGCHTIAGAGEDISKAGKAIEKTATKHAP